MLEDLSFRCDEVNNDLEALGAIMGAPASAEYDVILMDCQKPTMEGFEATKAIRS